MLKLSVRIGSSVSKISDSFLGDIFDPLIGKILFSGPQTVQTVGNNNSR